MAKFKTLAEMSTIREADAKLREEERRNFVPEKNSHKPVAYFEISRYTTGDFRGLFLVTQMLTEDASGNPLKKPIRKVIAEGVDMVVCMSSIETETRRRVFR